MSKILNRSHIYIDRTIPYVVLLIILSLSLTSAGELPASEWQQDRVHLDQDAVIRLVKLRPSFPFDRDSTRQDSLRTTVPGEEGAHLPGDGLPLEEKHPSTEPALPADIKTPAVEQELPPPDISAEEEKQPVEKSPFGAAVRSLVVPGWGQFYTENRLKGILIGGVEVTLFALWFTEREARDRDFDEYERTANQVFLTSSIDHGDRADNFLSWALLTTLMSGLDAYIDAHLYRFEEKVRMGGEVEVSFRLY